MVDIINHLLESDPLVNLVQKDNFVGWVYTIDYENALVVTNDNWKDNVKGIPHNSFLVATSFDPENYSKTSEIDKEVILLRVIDTVKLPQDDHMVETKIDNYQNQTSVYLDNPEKDFDSITKNKLQFGGLQCRVLGTFYMKDHELKLGSDIETFSVSMRMSVFMPKGSALETIVNYVDPIRKQNAAADFKALGISKDVEPFNIGTIRYTSTDRLHRADSEIKVPFKIHPSDFLARRTAVLGMTRTGKSNMVKQTVSVVRDISSDCNLKIGQLIYDVNGEYANANQQDKGSISDIYGAECVRYRMITTAGDGFMPLLNNFYEEIEEGQMIINDVIMNSNPSNDLKIFAGISLEKPDPSDISAVKRWERKIALYKTVLFKAKFDPGSKNSRIRFTVSQDIMDQVSTHLNPNTGISLLDAVSWFEAARMNNRANTFMSSSSSKNKNDKKPWFDDECIAMLNVLCCKNNSDTSIMGYKALFEANKYHTSARAGDVANEIYELLLDGKIVILDLSVGNAKLREKISKRIASYVFDSSMKIFTEGNSPSNIVIYVEEAHNLIGRGMDLTETWPRLAKEGAKYKIALVYATQEVSSVHPNILANTENWFVSHLNSQQEIKELAKFYDFADFSQSLLRSQDVGFTRVKTLSGPFVIPVQIDKFDPEAIKARLQVPPCLT